jgi:hypothetical protein
VSRANDIRTIALRDVLEEDDPEYQRRYVQRWYAKRFATPLHFVADLPEDDVVRAYWEERYEEMRDAAEGEGEHAKLAREDLSRERERLRMTPEEFAEARREAEAEERRVQDYLERLSAEDEAAPSRSPDGAEAALPDAPGGISLADLPEDVVVQFPVDLDGDALGGMLDV